MNEANLQRLIDHIEANKTDFNQSESTNCIVGTAARLAGYNGLSTQGLKNAAREFLGVDYTQINTFFDSDSWPDVYKDKYDSVSRREEVNVALDYLRSFLSGAEDVTHTLGGGLSLLEGDNSEDVLVLKKGKATVSIPLTLAQIRKLHLLFGKIVWENS